MLSYRPALLLVLVLSSPLAFSQTKYYQCKDEWGRSTFSERPCGADAKEGSINAPAANTQSTTSSKPAGTETFSHETTRAKRRLSEIEDLLERSDRRIARLESERDQEVRRLNSQTKYVGSVGAAIAWQDSVAEEVQTVKRQYNGRIEKEEEEIKDLKRERKTLKKQLAGS